MKFRRDLEIFLDVVVIFLDLSEFLNFLLDEKYFLIVGLAGR